MMISNFEDAAIQDSLRAIVVNKFSIDPVRVFFESSKTAGG